MEFLEAFHYLEKLRAADPLIGYHFSGDVLIVHREIWCVEGVPELFDQARKMFEPVD